jgi:hypothetical protein
VYQDEGVVAPSEPVEGPSTSFLANCFAIRSNNAAGTVGNTSEKSKRGLQ